MSFLQERETRRFCVFLLGFAVLMLAAGLMLTAAQVHAAKAMLLAHDAAVASSLLSRGVAAGDIAAALTEGAADDAGRALLARLGMTRATPERLLPVLTTAGLEMTAMLLVGWALLALLLLGAAAAFLRRRERLYEQAADAVARFAAGEIRCAMPQAGEGAIYRLFAGVERLATALRAKNEAEQKAHVFLKETISDISHQLKTPLAAMTMYQEIMEDEARNPQTVRVFLRKMGVSLARMEGLIASMLKITRLDAGSIVFERERCRVAELVRDAVGELTTRAGSEGKHILLCGKEEDVLVCDRAWTAEAIGNVVKNALDHTQRGGTIRIAWTGSPAALRLTVEDDGEGIAPEDIHHIFKRFYRSARTSSGAGHGVGLGLPLARAIVEGQGGLLTAASEPGRGAAFTFSFLTES
ncbi:MAG: HAMP domain-containing sensor histidine kinase [Clostridia bacterium]|nr:HAMP domain-containing sensor histidine kinase [Clostridia bacterium]